MGAPQPAPEFESFMYEVLRKQAADLRQSGQVHSNSSERNCCVVIVEPRKHKFLELVVRNAMHFLREGTWNLTIFCGSNNEEYVRNLLPAWKYRVVNLGIDNMTADEHNLLLRQKSFWQAIPEEHILITQTDACMLRDGIEKFLYFDFIGAFTLNPYEQAPLTNAVSVGFNGGFSLRQKSTMLECLQRVSLKDIDNYRKQLGKATLPSIVYNNGHVAEDVYFVHACVMLNKKLPSVSDACKFSTEAICTLDCIGMHACFHKKFFAFEQLKEMVKRSSLNVYL